MNKSIKNDWENAFAQKSEAAFGEAFAEDVVLEAAVLNAPITGRENVRKVMGAASKIYESLTFTKSATSGLQEYKEWEAQAFGGVLLKGITVLTRSENQAIAHIAIHHRPLGGALKFSAVLRDSLHGEIDPSYFYSENIFKNLIGSDSYEQID